MNQTDFIRKYYSAARLATFGTGIKPELLLSQAILESVGSGGVSSLAGKYHNWFGIKAGSHWKGQKVLLPTNEYINGSQQEIHDYFRAYPSTYEGFKDYINLLKKHYPEVTKQTTAENQAIAMGSSPYSTGPDYGNSLKILVNKVKKVAAKYQLGLEVTIPALGIVAVISWQALKYLKIKRYI